MKYTTLFLSCAALLLSACAKTQTTGTEDPGAEALTRSGEQDTQSALFYYAFDEKIYVNERTDILFLKFSEGLSVDQKSAIVKSNPALSPWHLLTWDGQEFIFDGSGRASVAILQSEESFSQSTLDAFRKMDGVKTLSFLLEKDKEYAAATDEMVVLLKSTSTEGQLMELAGKYNCAVKPFLVDGTPVQEGEYIVTVPKSVTMGTIRLANLFYETGLFVFTSPDMYLFDALQ